MECPGDTGRRQVPAAPLAIGFQRLDRSELSLVPVSVAVEIAVAPEREATAGLWPLGRAMFSAQQAAGERIINDHSDTLIAA